ncbi:hypothetical protein Tco_1279324 [Tanacetum coccineum]
MVAQRMAEEEALTEQQKKRKAQVQFEAQFYTEEDWDTIRAKLEANAVLSKDVLGQDLPEQDFAKRMVDMVNQRKKHFAEERAKAKKKQPQTHHSLRIYMSNYLRIKELGSFLIYMSFGATIKDFIREDLIELYRLVMQKYGTNRPEDAYDRVLWRDSQTYL